MLEMVTFNDNFHKIGSNIAYVLENWHIGICREPLSKSKAKGQGHDSFDCEYLSCISPHAGVYAALFCLDSG